MATQQAWQHQQRYRDSSSNTAQVLQAQNQRQGEVLAKALGWFSIGLGAAEVLAPRAFSRAIGLRPHPVGTALFGLREIAAGVGILRTQKPAEWLAARVAGDALDLAALGTALLSPRHSNSRVALATAAVLGVTLLDIYSTRQLSQRKRMSRRPTSRGIRVQRTMTVNCTADEAYRIWRDFTGFPNFMYYVQSVTTQDEGRTSHWVAKGPAGVTIEWDAELIEDRPGESIRWRSLPGAEIENSGSVQFRPAPGNHGTEVRVLLTYDPPAGQLGASIARLLGRSGEQEVREDVRRFKRFVETGEIPTTKGQPRGACIM